MTFSIIIPVYNVAQYIPKCLDSILCQDFADYEIICVNDGSTDNSLDVLTQYASSNKHLSIINQANAGTSAARNAGLNAATGDYIWFIDSDDWVEPQSLKILADNLSSEDMLCFSGKRFFEQSSLFEAPDSLLPEKNISGWEYFNLHALQHRTFSFVCVVLRIYKRTFLLKNNLFFDIKISHEDNLWVPTTCYFAQSVKTIPNPLYIYRIRKNSKMGEVSTQRKIDTINVANKLAQFFISKPETDKTTIYQSITHHYQAAFQNASSKEDKELLPNVRWNLYKTVSRTKPRHRIQYLALRISPKLFRFVNKKLSDK